MFRSLAKIDRFALALVLAGCTDAKAQRSPVPTVINGGFEDVVSPGRPAALDSGPVAWTATLAPATKREAIFSVDASESHEGQRSASLEVHPSRWAPLAYLNWFQVIEDTLDAEIEYELKGWMRCQGTLSPDAIVQFFDGKRQELGRVDAGLAQRACGTSEWHSFTLPFQPPPRTRRAFLRVGAWVTGPTAGKVWFDDLRIRESGQ